MFHDWIKSFRLELDTIIYNLFFIFPGGLNWKDIIIIYIAQALSVEVVRLKVG